MVNLAADAHAYQQVARSLAGADKAIRREFSRALRDVGKPFGQYVLAAGAQNLPRRGGLAYAIAGGRVGVAASPMRATITLRTKSGNKLRAIDQGNVRHPVYARQGKPRRWVDQPVEPGGFSKAFEAHAETIRPAMIAAGERALRAITEGKP